MYDLNLRASVGRYIIKNNSNHLVTNCVGKIENGFCA